ncbi:MAG: bifunctional adenosylcobinamide kinase/adenosylcobinamide-phosphate guanylyltransferase [Oscillospiraceae bacterium]
MILIVGGAYQGKRQYAQKRYGLDEADIIAGDDMQKISSAKCIDGFEKFVYNNGESAVKAAEKLLGENPGVIIIMTEIGSGIIPLDRTERRRRELVGQTGCFLAERAEIVIRMTCGIPQLLKGDSL